MADETDAPEPAEERRLRDAAEGGDADAAFELGNLLASRGDLKDAQQSYERADEAGHGAGATSLGVLLEHHGDRDGALEAYRRADERGDREGAGRLGLMLSAADDWDGAAAAWKRADERGSDQPLPIEGILAAQEAAATRAQEVPGGRRPTWQSPVLIGAVTVLTAMVAVLLSYNANSGLPFVPSRQLKVDIADGSNLVVGNDVREGGNRIGLVSAMHPLRFASGLFGAQMTLKLSESAGKVPIDSRITVLSKSVLGLKFVDLIKGTSSRYFADGGTMPESRTMVPVQIDQVFDTFNAKTRSAIQRDLTGFGDTFAGRGAAFNDTISDLPELLTYLRPVAAYLSNPSTQLTRFFTNLDTFMRVVAPVAGVNARLFGDAATTFAAFIRDPQAYEQTIAQSPSTLSVSTDSLRAQQPFLTDFAALGRALTPATAELRQALPDINPALEAGARTLARTPVLNSKLQQVMVALRALSRAPGTNLAINALAATVDTLNPMVKYLGPYQTVCDYWDYWWTFLSEHISEATSFGFAQRALLNQTNPAQTNNVGTAGATAPVNGGVSDSAVLGGDEFLHSQNYGAAIDNQGNADCETGQRGYPKKLNASDPQHRDLGLDPHTPGDQGPTFHGRARVPKGETFSRNPTTGPQLTPNPSNP